MSRIECNKCFHVDGDPGNPRCRLKTCQPMYVDMIDAKQRLLEKFPKGFFNGNNEFIAHTKGNPYFLLDGCEYPEDIACKVLEWLSRSASYAMPYFSEWRNEKYRKSMLKSINDYLGTDFSTEDIERIYTYLGNGCNHTKTIEFVRSNYALSVLEPDKTTKIQEDITYGN